MLKDSLTQFEGRVQSSYIAVWYMSYSNVNNGHVNTKMVKKEFVLTRKEKVLCQYT